MVPVKTDIDVRAFPSPSYRTGENKAGEKRRTKQRMFVFSSRKGVRLYKKKEKKTIDEEMRLGREYWL